MNFAEDDREVKRLAAHKKTQLCRFFSVGACTRGESCAFAHGSDQLRQQPDFSKTRLCADFVELGRCTLGRKCKFAHGKRELRPGSAAKIGRPGKAEEEEEEVRETLPHAEPFVQTFGLQQSFHEEAALQIFFRKADVAVSQPVQVLKKSAEKDDCNEDWGGTDSMSRQVTWEGVESFLV